MINFWRNRVMEEGTFNPLCLEGPATPKVFACDHE